jgi:hypothetical protein
MATSDLVAFQKCVDRQNSTNVQCLVLTGFTGVDSHLCLLCSHPELQKPFILNITMGHNYKVINIIQNAITLVPERTKDDELSLKYSLEDSNELHPIGQLFDETDEIYQDFWVYEDRGNGSAQEYWDILSPFVPDPHVMEKWLLALDWRTSMPLEEFTVDQILARFRAFPADIFAFPACNTKSARR